ncbi:MAG: PilZ domain-containing protein [Cellvibrionaceae bacterium]|nr:PilZ domain-containing protein [Cellvibrionaceae bacterium]MCV6627362.1 PilZ domain-containing protein [Cellvibrionaceae bacterium]
MGQERRRFFRIDDSIGVAYRVLSEEEVASQIEGELRPVDSLNLLASFDNKISNLSSQLQAKEPLVSELIDTLNAKLTAVINLLELDSQLVKRVAYKVHEVNISACGMAFFTDEALDMGAMISLELSLSPGNVLVHCYARIVASDEMEPGEGQEGKRFYVRMDFANMSEHDQEILIQHIVRRQGHQLREAREDQEPQMDEG